MTVSFVLNLHKGILNSYHLQSEIDQDLLGTAKLKQDGGNKENGNYSYSLLPQYHVHQKLVFLQANESVHKLLLAVGCLKH